MPELPEVEVVRRGLADELVDDRVRTVDVTGPRTVRRHDAAEVVAAVRGRRVRAVNRRGKYLAVDLGGRAALVVHLGMSGRLLVAPSGTPRPRHTHAVFGLASGRELRFVDPRTFGELFVSRVGRDGRVEAFSGLGLDPLLDAPTCARLAEVLARRVQLKALLMDQHRIAGLGNIYSDEILWHAGLRGDRRAVTLAADEIERLGTAMTSVLEDAIACGGSSLADAAYVDAYGELGRYQERHVAYGREGRPCPRCGAAVAEEVERALHLLLPVVPAVSAASASRVRRHVLVSGRVHNVWFRDGSGRRVAEDRGVDGWVRNLADGRVEAVFEGPAAAVDEAVAWCRTGPPRARVQRIDVREELPAGESGFEIR